jgi:Fe-S cluster assembly protein SufD
LRALEQKPMLPSAVPPRIDGGALRARLAGTSFAGAAYRLVLIDGRFAPGLSTMEGLPAGVWLGSTAEALSQRPDLVRSRFESPSVDSARPFAALNAAFFADGFVLDVAPDVTLDQPIEIMHLSSGEGGASFHTRSLVSVGAGSRVSVLENFAGNGDYWRNDLVELRLAAGADLTRVTLVEEAADALHFGEALATLGGTSRLSDFVLLLGGRTVRRETTIRSEAEGTRSELNGAFLLSGRQEANILTTVDHAAPRGETRETFKGVATDRGHGAFQGRITVRPGAQKVDAQQTSRNLVLGPRAAIDTKPELEIFADDVKCSHGATVGDLDETALFYLRARGIPTDTARRMLVEAFAREGVELIENAPIREHLLSRLARRLATLEV